MEQYSPESAWMLAGVIVAVLTGIGKKLGWVPEDRVVKQITALVVSCIVVMLFPVLQGQPLPVLGLLVVQMLQTWLSSMATYSVYQTAARIGEAKGEKADEKEAD